MTRAQIEKAKSELEHALRALDDGSGYDEWGAGPISAQMWGRATKVPPFSVPSIHAANAFDTAAMVAVRFTRSTVYNTNGQAVVPAGDRARFIAAMRKLAPVMLEVLLERDGDAND